jgi:putative transposase
LSRQERIKFIDKSRKNLSVAKQCKLLGINRSTLYYHAVEKIDANDVELMNEIREIWSCIPFYGYRRITKELRAKGHKINRKKVQRLMKLAGICAIYPKPRTSIKNKEHTTYPYLLKDLEINRVNQVWEVDITYLKLGNGFMYLVALIDVHSRYIVDWELSNTLDAEFCVAMLQRTLRFIKPEIINSDQGCQFTSEGWINMLKANGITISMDGKGRCLDNIYIERFWRSFKYEDFHLNDYQSVPELRKGVKTYMEFYNHRRWHQALDYKTPAEVYFESLPVGLWTSPSDQPEPFGTCVQAANNLMENANAFPTSYSTACPHSLASRPQGPQAQLQ